MFEGIQNLEDHRGYIMTVGDAETIDSPELRNTIHVTRTSFWDTCNELSTDLEFM